MVTGYNSSRPWEASGQYVYQLLSYKCKYVLRIHADCLSQMLFRQACMSEPHAHKRNRQTRIVYIYGTTVTRSAASAQYRQNGLMIAWSTVKVCIISQEFKRYTESYWLLNFEIWTQSARLIYIFSRERRLQKMRKKESSMHFSLATTFVDSIQAYR